MSEANPEYRHPFLIKRSGSNKAGMIVVTTDKGLCGGLNTNILARGGRQASRNWKRPATRCRSRRSATRASGFMNRMGAALVSHVIGLGDTPHLEKLIGAVKVQLDAYEKGEVDSVYLAYKFINTMKQEAVVQQPLPLTSDKLESKAPRKARLQLGLHLRTGCANRR